jgi:hypothetical protein
LGRVLAPVGEAEMSSLFESSTYTRDLLLFKGLGLKPFSKAKHGEELFVGKVRIQETGTVDVFVTCFPAQFWRLVIHSTEGRDITLKTGSGTLQDYWPIAQKFAESMVVVEEVKVA